MSLEHTLLERPDVSSFLAEFEPPPMSASLQEAATKLARELAGAWSHGALPAGVQLGSYTIQGPLGQGGQATVYLAEDAAGERFAIKVPRQELLARLVTEAQILFHLDHPRVVRIVAADVKSSPPYLVTEHLSGGTLAAVLEAAPEGRLSPERVRDLALGVLDALAYAHEKGVVHRDLKPSNILFDAEGAVKVADFGIGSLALAKRLEGTLVSHDLTGVAGTPLYMAPEQEQGARVDGRADLYSLGKLVYQALTGRSPRTIRPLRHVLPAGHSGLDLSWEDFILRLVEDDPGERYVDAASARAALAALPLLGSLAPAPLAQEFSRADLRALPASQAVGDSPVEPEAERAPWATGEVVDHLLAVAQRLSSAGQGGLFAFVPEPWSPGPSLGGVRETSRPLADLEGLLSLDPLGIALRGRTIRATFSPRGPESSQEWLTAAVAEYLTIPSEFTPPRSIVVAGPESTRLAGGGAPRGDWLDAARRVRREEQPGPTWVWAPIDPERFVLVELDEPTPARRQFELDRVAWFAQRCALVLGAGHLAREISPGPSYDTTQRNWIANQLAHEGGLVLHVEPSGRWLVFQGERVQSTRSVAYLRRLLEGGLGLAGPPAPAPPLEWGSAAPPRRRWGVPAGTAVFLTTLLGFTLALFPPSALQVSLGIAGSLGLGLSIWWFRRITTSGREKLSNALLLWGAATILLLGLLRLLE